MIYANIYNDLLVKTEDIEVILQTSVKDKLNSINSNTQAVYIVTYVTLVLYFVTVIYVMRQYLNDTIEFFSLFANHSTEDLSNRIKNLEYLKDLISSDAKRDTDVVSLDDHVITSQSKVNSKAVRTNKLAFFVCIKRLFIYLALLIPSIAVLILSYRYSFDYEDEVLFQLENIMKISKITNRAYLLYNEIALNDLLQGNAYVKGKNVLDIIDSEIDALEDSVSTTKIFDRRLNEMLSANLCDYYTLTDIANPCDILLDGIGKQGIRAFVYYFYDLAVREREFLANVTYNFWVVVGLVTRQYRADLYYMIANAMVPAVTKFIDLISGDLLIYLDDQLSSIIDQFIASLIIDVVCLVSMIILVYWNLKKERNYFVRTLNFVPIDFILINNNFKMYMIKEGKDFLKLFKHTEMLKKKYINVKKA